MCTRLHSIGFPCEIDRATAKAMDDIAANPSKRVACAAGEYRVWRGGSGAEIWLHYPKPVPAKAPAVKTAQLPVAQPSVAQASLTKASLTKASVTKAGLGDLQGMTIFHRGEIGRAHV